MKVELDIGRLEKAVKDTRNAMRSMQEENDKLTKKFIKKAKENLRYIAVTAIDKFYEDYEPHFYERTFDLYNTYKITVTEDEWSIDFDSSWMTEWHRADNEYIFENSFIRGWHGGAIDGEGHPDPGVPYWRWPDITYTAYHNGQIRAFSKNSPWFSPSLRSPSPYKEIVRKSNLYMDLEIAKYHKEYNDNIEKFQKQTRRNLERIR